MTFGWDLENFEWRTEVRDISAWWTEVRDTKSLKLLAFRHRWSNRQNSFTAPLTMTGGNFLTLHTARVTPATATAARNALGPKSGPPRKRLAFPNALPDSQKSCTARLSVTRGNILSG